MTGYVTNIEAATLENDDFRRVLYTAPHMQLVLMSLAGGEDIGEEVHQSEDQFIRVEEGSGKAMLNGEEHMLEDGFVVMIPAGTHHNIINTSATDALRLYTIYAPAHHPDGTVHKTKADAMAAEAHE